MYVYKKKKINKPKENLGLLKFKNLQTNFLTFHSKLHCQLAAPAGLNRDSGSEWMDKSIFPRNKKFEVALYM